MVSLLGAAYAFGSNVTWQMAEERPLFGRQ